MLYEVITGTTDQLTVKGYFTSSAYKVEKVQFDVIGIRITDRCLDLDSRLVGASYNFV